MAVERQVAVDIRRKTVYQHALRYSCTVHLDVVDAARRSTQSHASVRRCAGRRRTCLTAAGSAWLAR